MKRTTLIGAIVLIFAVTFAIEYFVGRQFDTGELTVSGVNMETGVTHQFLYLKSMENVGTYTYSVVEDGGDYLMTGSTDVSNDGKRIQLDAVFTFTDQLEPVEYEVQAISDGDESSIRVEFSDSDIISWVTVDDVTLNITEEYVDGVFLVENNMPGFWEIILNSVTLEEGVKYNGNIYIPQGAVVFPITLVVSKDPQNIWVDGVQLSCKVVKEADLDMSFYLYEGELVQLRDDTQDLMFQKVR